MEIKVRELVWQDTYTMSEIFDKIDIQPESFSLPAGTTNAEVAAVVIMAFIRKMHNAKEEMNAFMADLTGMTAEQFAQLPMKDAAVAVQQLMSQDGFMDFFK